MTDREVLAFDLYGTLVDPIAISGELGRVLGESVGAEAARLWRGKQLEYSFRLTAMGQYEDFRWVTSRALDFALACLGARLPEGEAGRLVELYDHLEPFPDAVPALRALSALGYELAVFSNGTPAMIGHCLGNSGLGEFFAERISVDEVRVFKPSPVVYRHAARRLSLPVRQVRLVTSNAFDCVGPAPPEPLGSGNEGEALHGVLAVDPVAAGGAAGREKSRALVEPQRRRRDTSALSKLGYQQVSHSRHGKPSSRLEGQARAAVRRAGLFLRHRTQRSGSGSAAGIDRGIRAVGALTAQRRIFRAANPRWPGARDPRRSTIMRSVAAALWYWGPP